MSEPRSTAPRIVATCDDFRLVHRVRDEFEWPNVSDLTLERQEKDSLGVEQWVRVRSWCLSAQSPPFLDSDHATIALKMLLDPGPVVKEPA